MTAIEVCVVCEEAVSPPNLAQCLSCYRFFHLQMRTDGEGKDCGEAWLHEVRMHIVFGCHACIDADMFSEEAS